MAEPAIVVDRGNDGGQDCDRKQVGGDRDLLVAALAGLAVAIGVTGLLAWLLRRR